MHLEQVKSLDYLHVVRKPRLIVSVLILWDGRAALVDRKNNELIVTDIDKHWYTTIGLGSVMPPAPQGASQGRVGYQPSAISKGQTSTQVVITFTHDNHSMAVLCDMNKTGDMAYNLIRRQMIRVDQRTRSVVMLEDGHFVATTPQQILVLSPDGSVVRSKNRSKKDRGGLLSTDGKRTVYYGDGDSFVSIHWSGNELTELFRFTHGAMKFPRGSVVSQTGNVLVCCDTSHNIHAVATDGTGSGPAYIDPMRSFGDIDMHSDGSRFVTTFWLEDTWPLVLVATE